MEEFARLADAAEKLVARFERKDRDEVYRELGARFGDPKPPTTLSMSLFLTSIPGLAERFDRTVPPEFVARTGDGDMVACPCGETPLANTGRLIECGCGRWFLSDGRQIWVALSPA